MKKIKEFWASLDQSIVVNKRELVLGVAACTLAGIVIGTFLSPTITLTIGNNNQLRADSPDIDAPQEENAAVPTEEIPDEAPEA